ncbi:MAG TPA: glycosyltransferase family 9 protein [Steroidobacteraceae bacterium]
MTRLQSHLHRTSIGVGRLRSLEPVVIRFGRLGDMVILSSLLHFLHDRFHNRCIVLGAGSWNAQLYRAHPDVERIWSFARHIPFVLSLTWWRVLWALHRTAPGPIYVCERHPRQLARIRRLLGLSGVDRARCLFITDFLTQEDEHWVDRFVRFGEQTPPALDPADYPLPLHTGQRAPRLHVTDSERAQRDAWLHERGWCGRRLVLVQPGNFRTMSRRRERWRRLNADDKAWPMQNWVDLLRGVQATMPDAVIVLCGAPQEGLLLQQIAFAAAPAHIAVVELPLRPLLALCEAATAMISIDTGPAHAAAALGLPLIVLYGAESPACWLPRSPSASPVLAVGGPPTSTRVDQISVADVLCAWRTLRELERQASRPG